MTDPTNRAFINDVLLYSDKSLQEYLLGDLSDEKKKQAMRSISKTYQLLTSRKQDDKGIKINKMMIKDMKEERTQSLIAKVSTSGLLINSGYHHAMKDVGDVNIGSYFDQISGLPFISGSSIKGVFRHVLQNKAVFRRICRLMNLSYSDELYVSVLSSMFEEGFIYYPALITAVGEEIFDIETWNRHKERKSPDLLKVLKLAYGVEFEFMFDIEDIYHEGEKVLSVGDLIEIFKYILEVDGLGARTTHGYGRFEVLIEESSL